ncbi:unnamed protein product, partial [marine sediment metagenome]
TFQSWISDSPSRVKSLSNQNVHIRSQYPEVNVLGVGINAVSMSDALDCISHGAKSDGSKYLCLAAVHSILDCRRDSDLKRIFNSALLTTPDGMPLVWLCRLNGHAMAERVYGPDLMLAACEDSVQHGYKHFLLGGEPQVTRELTERLEGLFPGIAVVGSLSPPFRVLTKAEDADIVDRINNSDADIVWVGLGTGKQERWIAEHLGKIRAPVMIGVGAAFDLLSGQTPQAPRWMQGIGFEWLFRLAMEPRRLWRRYAEYPLFAMLLLTQLTKLKKFEMED